MNFGFATLSNLIWNKFVATQVFVFELIELCMREGENDLI